MAGDRQDIGQDGQEWAEYRQDIGRNGQDIGRNRQDIAKHKEKARKMKETGFGQGGAGGRPGGGPAEPAGPATSISPMTLIICFCKNCFTRLSPQGAGRIQALRAFRRARLGADVLFGMLSKTVSTKTISCGTNFKIFIML